LYWIKEDGSRLRHKILYNNFLVILEERDKYYLLITGFYVEKDYYRKGLEKEYIKCV